MVAVGAVIKDQERVLLVKHVPGKRGFWEGKWICPGGRLEVGETLAEGVRREVMEETNLEIDLEQPLPPFDTVVKRGEGVELHVVYIDYLARRQSGELKAASDVGEARWVSVADLPTIWGDLHQDTQRLLTIAGLRSEAPPEELTGGKP
ncbi:MAG: NUDIX domain-containing protein [Dehalococcoidia bacterium]|jgi:ADP-ribose pyrophosphatase YjhB (NUDIX family)|nr:NUDIX domain-containing protein [Dehalococcoidia bacterium]MDP7240112.1 NUDIX domain-containing protein [Dehalococcoidia bacterium]